MTLLMSDIAAAPARRRGTRCPSCGARVTSASSWCSLCFTDLQGTADPQATPETAETADVADVADVEPPAAVEQAADGENVADQLLAELAVATRTSTAPRFGFLTTTGGRVVAMLVGTVALTALGFGLLTLGGALL